MSLKNRVIAGVLARDRFLSRLPKLRPLGRFQELLEPGGAILYRNLFRAEEVGQSGKTHEMFCTMERRLLRAIMNPAMIATWIFGLMLVFTPGIVEWSSIWPWTKLLGVLAMTWFHHWLGLRRKEFLRGENTLTGRRYRLMNEVPTVFMVLIVISVIVRF